MGWKTRSMLFVFIGILIGAASGCDRKPAPIPANSFRAVVEDIVVDDLVLVKRITITAPGRRSVGVTEKGGVERVWGDPDPQTGLTTVQVVIVADLIRSQPASENLLHWLVRMSSGGSTVGGRQVRPAGSAGSLRDLLSFRLDPGDHRLSRDLTLGYLQDRELILRVE